VYVLLQIDNRGRLGRADQTPHVRATASMTARTVVPTRVRDPAGDACRRDHSIRSRACRADRTVKALSKKGREKRKSRSRWLYPRDPPVHFRFEMNPGTKTNVERAVTADLMAMPIAALAYLVRSRCHGSPCRPFFSLDAQKTILRAGWAVRKLNRGRSSAWVQCLPIKRADKPRIFTLYT